MYQQMLGSQDFTNLIFPTNLGRFEKRLRTTAIEVYRSNNSNCAHLLLAISITLAKSVEVTKTTFYICCAVSPLHRVHRFV